MLLTLGQFFLIIGQEARGISMALTLKQWQVI